MAFFDKEQNKAGALTTMLETDAANIKNMAGPTLGVALQSIFCLVVGLAIAFYYSWRMSLVM
eukprot:CAMPEP_0115015862 /NCGR_PEP_ID=MMETSP0216-20121206/27047_1 /TAXON_ID=223996 /ORGANISM="Protocruzia adherens, Strain Boccale" /LENGTH=61 /DNA_ID=CAMNT_0002386115 /DNA_START=92 /DNA_END=274 /DNA_ORIENTATION=-